MFVLRVVSVCEIVVFRLMSDAGVLEVRRGAKRKGMRAPGLFMNSHGESLKCL